MVDPSSDPARLVPQHWYLYQARRVCTAGVGGGAMRVRINVPANTVYRLGWVQTVGPASAGSNTQVSVYDENDAATTLGTSAAAANSNLFIPQNGATGTTSVASGSMGNTLGLLFGPGQKIVFSCSTSLQNETLTVAVCLLSSTDTIPTWDTTGSVAPVVLAASTISAANTMQPVSLPW